MDTSWNQIKARELKVGSNIIRNVEPNMEWVPGPYGSFIVEKVKAYGDEFRIVARESWGGAEAGAQQVKFSYDGDELVTVKVEVH